MPVAKQVVVVHKPDPLEEISGRHGLRWEYYKSEHDTVDYDTEMLPLLSPKMLPRLIDHMFPNLDPRRKKELAQKNWAGKMHAAQRKAERAAAPALESGDAEHRARRYTKRERGALKRLKQLLRDQAKERKT